MKITLNVYKVKQIMSSEHGFDIEHEEEVTSVEFVWALMWFLVLDDPHHTVLVASNPKILDGCADVKDGDLYILDLLPKLDESFPKMTQIRATQYMYTKPDKTYVFRLKDDVDIKDLKYACAMDNIMRSPKTSSLEAIMKVLSDSEIIGRLGKLSKTDEAIKSKLFGFIHEINRLNFYLILQPAEVQWLLDRVIAYARETMHDEDIRRFIGMFEVLGYQFKYTTRDGWNVIGMDRDDKLRAEHLMRGETPPSLD